MNAFVFRIAQGFRPATRALLSVTLLATLSAVANAQTPAAGIQISNQATASYEMGDVTINLMSNRVQVTVAPVEGLNLTADNTKQVPIGAPVSFPHRLTNTGSPLPTISARATRPATITIYPTCAFTAISTATAWWTTANRASTTARQFFWMPDNPMI